VKTREDAASQMLFLHRFLNLAQRIAQSDNLQKERPFVPSCGRLPSYLLTFLLELEQKASILSSKSSSPLTTINFFDFSYEILLVSLITKR
jgi:hypothetical protein